MAIYAVLSLYAADHSCTGLPRLVPRLAMTRGETLRCFHTHDTLVPPSLLALPYFSAFLSIDSCAKDGYNSIISYNKTGCVAMPKQKGK